MLRFLSILIFVIILSFSLKAQVLNGTVKDSETGDPVAIATIFFNNHRNGTFSDKNGNFEVIVPASGYLELIVSHIAYNNLSLVFDQGISADTSLTISLSPSENELDEVEITADPDRKWKKSFKKFKSYFLGRSDNASQCEIINPFVINLNQKDGVLTASSDHLIQIENRSTGYTVYFLLEHFRLKGDQVSYSGKPFFELIPPVNEKMLDKWEKNREKTYLGSKRHFLNSLTNGKLVSEGYEMFRAGLNSAGQFETKEYLDPGQVLYTDQTGSYLLLDDFLMVVYKKEKSSGMGSAGGPFGRAVGHRDEQELTIHSKNQFRDRDKFQTSYLFGRKQKIRVLEDGTFKRPELILEYGHWASEGVADLLPFDYKPGS